jgi:hypothetical protein
MRIDAEISCDGRASGRDNSDDWGGSEDVPSRTAAKILPPHAERRQGGATRHLPDQILL